MCCCSGPTCRAARRRGAYRSSRPRLSTYAPVEPDSLIENQKILGKKAPSLTPIGNFHFILATRFSHSSSHSSISRWCTGGGVLLSNFQVPTFQTSNIFFPVVSLLPCGCVVITCCGSTRVVRPFSFFPVVACFVLVRRNGGKGCLHSEGGDETRRTQHARARAEAAEPNGSGDGGRSRNSPPTAPRDLLTPRLGCGNDATATAFLKNDGARRP